MGEKKIALIRQWPGQPYPLSARWDGRGVKFALFSEHATERSYACSILQTPRKNVCACVLPNIPIMCGDRNRYSMTLETTSRPGESRSIIAL